MRRPWTMKELQFLKENHNLMSNKELAKALDRTVGSVANQKVKNGLTKRNIYEVVKGYEVLATGTVEECAEQTGLSVSTIRFYTTPAHRRRSVDLDKAILVHRVDDT
ncbi:hypothetical protein [Oceanobacillus indicireducens]|uniref:Uncharacterized protein n=1 Tax=Oceanobacillus indicireducens TaxID=1004261 RepID=A0A918D5C1_9BACI|nr:hypothetical protein [Oceanobacillus indicireducens]GGN66407.1 hypothetical protein GCM10007971_36350 [Oceanobacillus indicireducens]